MGITSESIIENMCTKNNLSCEYLGNRNYKINNTRCYFDEPTQKWFCKDLVLLDFIAREFEKEQKRQIKRLYFSL